jgi:hypothetical protein
MKRLLIYLAMLVPILSALAAERMPSDVQRFIDKREGCDHMRGEIPDPAEKQRMKEINREIHKLCTGTDKQLEKLKRKYAADSTVIQILNEYESGIEASNAQVPKNRRTFDE